LLAAGQAGEVVVRGPVVMRGYLRRPDESEQALRGGWLHTGDVGRFYDDGYLTLVDRVKDMIIRGGENIYPKEIEDVLYAHPAVLEAAVVGQPDPVLGEQPVAFVAFRPGRCVVPDDLIEHCRESLARYKVPRAVYVEETLPKNAGKGRQAGAARTTPRRGRALALTCGGPGRPLAVRHHDFQISAKIAALIREQVSLLSDERSGHRTRTPGHDQRAPGVHLQPARPSGRGVRHHCGSGDPPKGRRVMLWGRRQQCRVLDGLLADVRAGRSRALVVRGEPGIGKTALLGYAAGIAPDFRVVRAGGVESEMELPFAALHQLCGRMLGRLGALPGLQRDALGVAFGLRPGSAPDRFLVGLAALGLLSEVAAGGPLLCLVDDAQWLDRASAQALAFAAGRLDAESVALLFGSRDLAAAGDLAGLPGLAVAGLADADARAVLASVLPGRLDERVRDRIIAESAGSPLALLELPRGMTAAELAGGFGLPGPLPVAGRIERSFLGRIALLPEVTQRLLLLAAAEPAGDPALLWRAAGRLGIGVEAAAPAVAGGLLAVGARVIFGYPLVRSAVYRAAPVAERCRAHGALAGATDPGTDPDRRAWHRAQAAAGPDEDVAAGLEQSAGRAQARGGLAAAAAFLERAAALTPGPPARAARTLAAAAAAYEAGMPDAAVKLLAMAEAGPLGELERARLERLQAQVAFTRLRGSDAPRLLLRAARRLGPLDAALARETYLEALWAAIRAGQPGDGPTVREVAEAASAAPPAADPPRAVDLLLDALVTRSVQGHRAAVPRPGETMMAAIRNKGDSTYGKSGAWLTGSSRRKLATSGFR
jgi:AMP-binding enzyme/AMP-binding enzyme C-terminal domain/AAA ATPase domain